MFHSLRHTVSTTLSLVILATTAGLASAQSAPIPTAMRSQISIPQEWQINPYDHPPTPADLATLSATSPSSQVTSMPRARVMAQRNTMNSTQTNRVTIPQNWQINPYDHPPTPADLGITSYQTPSQLVFMGRNTIAPSQNKPSSPMAMNTSGDGRGEDRFGGWSTDSYFHVR
jgi:hypothetical protein